jgi:biopolymer transport protein ExbD
MSEINMTPLVDVMLVLVVILIITAPLMASSLKLDLPKSEAAAPNDAPRAVVVVIDAKGQIFQGDKPSSLEALSTEFKTAAQKRPDTEVQIRADQAVAYGKVVEVIGVAQKAGLNRIGFAAEQTKP